MPIPTLDKSANGYWYAKWSDAGRSKRKSMGTQDGAVAKERFAHWLLLGGDGADAPERIYTVADAWAVYHEKHVEPHVVGKATLDFNWKALQPHFGHLPVTTVDQDAVDGYVAKRTGGRLGRRVKPQTCRKELSTLSAALAFCTAKPHKLYDPSALQPFKLPDAAEPRDRWLTIVEVQRLLDAAARLRRGDRLSRAERFLWLGLETAARKQAILDLTWDRVHFDTGVIHYDVPGRKKTKKRRAPVPISRALRPVLERAYAERLDAKRADGLVLDNKAAVWAAIQNVAVEAGLGVKRARINRWDKPLATGISPHVLRHTAATHMARRGVPLWKVAKILGDTLATVERVYAKWAPDDPEGTVDMISNGALEAAE